MAAWLPIPSGFTGFAHRFVDPALGFALGKLCSALFSEKPNLLVLGWNYWFKVSNWTFRDSIVNLLIQE